MDVNIIQALLVFIVAFIMGIDQFSFLESLYQPIVTCPIIGAILGDFQLGIVVGGAYQLIQIGSKAVSPLVVAYYGLFILHPLQSSRSSL